METPKHRILVSDPLGREGLELLEAQGDVRLDVRPGMDRPTLLEAVAGADALVVRSATRADAEVVAAGKSLRVIGRAGIGVDNIDRAAAAARGIVVVNTPGANATATAEHTLAMLLAACRRIPAAHASVAAGEWRRADFVGVELSGRTLGVVGFGRIGRMVAERARAFGMQIVAYDPYVTAEAGAAAGAAMMDLEALLDAADVVTLHTIASPETHHLIDAAALARMKRGAILVNCARGSLVHAEALAEALRSGALRAAAIDVYEVEPPVGNPLIGLPGVVHVPHLGASTEEAQTAVSTEVARSVLAVLRGEPADGVVPPPA